MTAHIFIQPESLRVLDDRMVLLAEAIPHEIYYQDVRAVRNAASFQSVHFFLAPGALVFVLAEQAIGRHVLVKAVFEGQGVTFWRDLEGQGAVLHVRVALVTAAFAKDLTSSFEAEHFEDGGLLLVLHDEPLHWFLVLEAGLDEVVKEPEEELLGVLLFSPGVAWHDPFHVWLYNLSLCPPCLVSDLNILDVRAE